MTKITNLCTTLGIDAFNGISLGFIGSAACTIRPPSAATPGAFSISCPLATQDRLD